MNRKNSIMEAITKYVANFREILPGRFTPNLHMLEDPILPWIRKFGFGLELLGQHGGESAHREFCRHIRLMPGRHVEQDDMHLEGTLIFHSFTHSSGYNFAPEKENAYVTSSRKWKVNCSIKM